VDIELYLFGSSVRGKHLPGDLDVLLVYPDGDLSRGHHLAELLRALVLDQQLDVVALSRSEELELDFVRNEQAVRVWPTVD
jgi:predicted nucleotidyltransferase